MATPNSPHQRQKKIKLADKSELSRVATPNSLHQRQKRIKLADKSEAGWLAVKQYEADTDLASNSEDEERIKEAQATALWKKANSRQSNSFRFTPLKFLVAPTNVPVHGFCNTVLQFTGCCLLPASMLIKLAPLQ